MTITKIKSFSDLEQSRKLAEILPLESADMYLWSSGKRYYIEAMDDGDFNEEEGHVRAWSLAALLNVLPYPYIEQNYKGKWLCRVEHENTTYIWEDSNPVDACYEMILKLYELKMLNL